VSSLFDTLLNQFGSLTGGGTVSTTTRVDHLVRWNTLENDPDTIYLGLSRLGWNAKCKEQSATEKMLLLIALTGLLDHLVRTREHGGRNR
jgi:hypothetical protein